MLLLCSAAAPLLGAAPVAASGWSVTLSASSSDAAAGSTVTLTATANQDVGAAGYYIDVDDTTTGTPVNFCATGTTCDVAVSSASAASHTYVAYVDGDPAFEYPPCCVQAESNTVTVTWHPRATAGMDVAFVASGTLPGFPCPAGCAASFTGTGSGAGTAEAQSGSVDYTATFAAPSGAVTGTATYTEPGPPFCPAVGSAVGNVTLVAPATGSVLRSTTPSELGTITGVTFQLQFTYQRATAGTAITVTGGTATIAFSFPDTGSDYFVSSVSGAGLGGFDVDPRVGVADCQNAGSLPFTIAGDAALALT